MFKLDVAIFSKNFHSMPELSTLIIYCTNILDNMSAF